MSIEDVILHEVGKAIAHYQGQIRNDQTVSAVEAGINHAMKKIREMGLIEEHAVVSRRGALMSSMGIVYWVDSWNEPKFLAVTLK